VIPLRVLFGALRTVGWEQPLWWLRYRYQLGSGVVAIRSPLRRWEDLRFEDAVRPGAEVDAARYLEGEEAPRLFFASARSLAPQLVDLMGPRLQALLDEVVLASAGRYRLWEDSFRSCGIPPAWNRNPLTGRDQDASLHWTMIAERTTGDVKGLWELSRFAIAYRLVRLYAAAGEERAAQHFVRLADSWLRANPPNSGPQWMSGQEVGLRAMAWTFGLAGLWGSPALTREVRMRLAVGLREHGRRITASLAYAQAQGNNHLLSEASALWTLGLVFPWMRESRGWADCGRAMLIAAARRQIDPDGGYIQHSINYQRLAAQILAWSVRLGEVHQCRFPQEMYSRLRAMRDCLADLVDDRSGRAPNFGHNDGTLVLPLATCDFEDYRPVVQTLSLICDGRRRYPRGAWDEEAVWLQGEASDSRVQGGTSPAAVPRADARGGMIALTFAGGRGFLRCAKFRNRPAHADQLHCDLWSGELNFACDAGTFLYSGDPPWENALAASGVHNTVTVDGLDQMERVGRFLWVAEDAHAERIELHEGYELAIASHRGYRRFGVLHRRALIGIGGQAWVIVDDLLGRGTHTLRLHWLAPDGDVQLTSVGQGAAPVHADYTWGDRRARATVWASSGIGVSTVRAGEVHSGGDDVDTPPREVRGWRSLRYASREPALSLAAHMTAVLPARFVTIWVMDPHVTSDLPIDSSGLAIDLPAGAVRLHRLGSLDPIASVIVPTAARGAG